MRGKSVRTLTALALSAVLSMPIAAQVMDRGYQSHITPEIIHHAESSVVPSSFLSRRRPIRPIPSYVIPPVDELRLIIANPFDTTIDATIARGGEERTRITIPPHQLYVDENFCMTSGCFTMQTLSTRGVVVMKETLLNNNPPGVAGSTLDIRPRGTPGLHYFPLPTDSGRTMDVKVLNVSSATVPIVDVTISRGARSYAPAFGPVPSGQEVTFQNVARDSDDGFITGVPYGEIYQGTGFVSAHTPATLASRTVVRNGTNKDTYSMAADNTFVAWAVFLGIMRDTPLPRPLNHNSDVVGRSRVQVHFARGGALETPFSLYAVDEHGAVAQAESSLFAGKDATFQSPFPGAFGALEVRVLSGQQNLLVYGHNDVTNAGGMATSKTASLIEPIVASEHIPMLTYADMIGGNAIGVAAGIGQTLGAETIFHAYGAKHENPVAFKISIIDAQGVFMKSKVYALTQGQYRRIPLSDIIGEQELVYGTAIYTPIYGFGLMAFERKDRGGMDGIVGKATVVYK